MSNWFEGFNSMRHRTSCIRTIPRHVKSLHVFTTGTVLRVVNSTALRDWFHVPIDAAHIVDS